MKWKSYYIKKREESERERINKSYSINEHKKAFREYITIILNSITVILLVATAFFTAKTYLVFEAQLSVSQDAANDAHIAYTAVQRAFITMGDLRIEKTPDLIPGPIGSKGVAATYYWKLTPVAQNSGNTPTRFASALALATSPPVELVGGFPGQAVVGSRYDSLVQPINPDMFNVFPPIKLIIGPHSSAPIGGNGIPIEGLKSFHEVQTSKGVGWYIYGVIHYFDLFPHTSEHVTKYCYDFLLGSPTTEVWFLPTVSARTGIAPTMNAYKTASHTTRTYAKHFVRLTNLYRLRYFITPGCRHAGEGVP
jgi:hypothetical protein